MFILWIIVIFIQLFLLLKLYKRPIGLNKCSRHLIGKIVIVTGGSTGIGFETAKDLADRGAKVIIASRNEERGIKATDAIKEATRNNDVHFFKLDLSSLKSVRDFVEEVQRVVKHLDILVNNAGDFDLDIKTTEDELLLGMQVNYYGPFLLTNLLLPLLVQSPGSRIVNVASRAYEYGVVDLEDLNNNEGSYLSMFKVYARAKLCTVLSTIALSRRLENKVTVNALCPGLLDTNLLRRRNPIFDTIFKILAYFFARNSWEGAQTPIYLAVSRDVDGVSGCFFTGCKKRSLKTNAQDPEIANKLWNLSEKFVHWK